MEFEECTCIFQKEIGYLNRKQLLIIIKYYSK